MAGLNGRNGNPQGVMGKHETAHHAQIEAFAARYAQQNSGRRPSDAQMDFAAGVFATAARESAAGAFAAAGEKGKQPPEDIMRGC